MRLLTNATFPSRGEESAYGVAISPVASRRFYTAERSWCRTSGAVLESARPQVIVSVTNPMGHAIGETVCSAGTSSADLLTQLFEVLQITQPAEAEPQGRVVPDYEGFLSTATTSLKEVPFEDGELHPVTTILSEVLERDAGVAWVLALWQASKHAPGMVATFFRALGQLPISAVRGWVHGIAQIALKSPSVRVREGVVTALESWGDPRSLQLLKSRGETETSPWLRRYIAEVITDLH